MLRISRKEDETAIITLLHIFKGYRHGRYYFKKRPNWNSRPRNYTEMQNTLHWIRLDIAKEESWTKRPINGNNPKGNTESKENHKINERITRGQF